MSALTDHPATRRIAFAAVATALFAGIVAAATKSDDLAIGEGRLTARGRAAVIALDGRRREVTGTVALHTGETVEAVEGTMTIDLPDGSTVEGRPAAKASDPTRVKIAHPVELMAGDLLVTSKNGTDVVAAGNVIRLDDGAGTQNAMRVSRSLAVDATVYRGAVAFDSAGQTRAVPALRALEVAALGRPPSGPTPLRIDDSDAWDQRFLGDAIELGHTLDGYSATYSRSLGTANASAPAYYRSLLPSLADEPDFTAELLASTPHPSGETVVGAAIAALSRRASFTQRWHDVFAFRDAGATWGLVALDQGVATGPLLAEVQNALNNTPFPFALGGVTTTVPAGGAGPTTTTPSTTQPGGPTTTTTPPPSTPTTLVPAPPTGQPIVDGLVQDVNELLGGLVPPPPQR